MWKQVTILLVTALAACQPSATPTPIPTATPEPVTALESGEALILIEGEYDNPSLAALNMESGDVRILIADTETVTNDTGFSEMPARSPDGTMIAYEQLVVEDIPGGFQTNNDGIWLANFDGSDARPLIKPDAPEDGQEFTRPVWSPDGTRIAYINSVGRGIYVVPIEGGEPEVLLPAELQPNRMAWSPDGGRLLYSSDRRDEAGTLLRGIYIYDLETETETPVMVEEGVTFLTPSWSADGERITYIRWDLENDLQEIYISNADGSDVVNVTPGQAYAYDPQFSPDGTQLAYNHNDTQEHEYVITVLDLEGESEPRWLVEVGTNDRGPDW